MCSLNVNEAKLFAKSVPVSITDVFTTSFRSLFLSIEWKQTSTIVMRKELLITLTDNNDPFFLYNLQLSEEDYHRLRSSQNLLVDFSAFPQIVIDFLERCLNEANKPQPNYLLHLTMGELIGSMASTAQLDIEQSSVFRQVSLLSLKFLAATESAVKQHMTNCFQNLKEENQRLQQRLCYLEKDYKEKFSACETALENKTQELENVKKDLSEEINKRENKYTHILMEEREKLLNKQREGENRLENERIDRETKLKNEISKLESKVSCLEALNKEIESKNEGLEKQLSELRKHNLSAETELSRKSGALTSAERNNFELDNELKERNSRINHMMKDIHELNRDLNLKQEQLNRVQMDLDVSKKEKKKMAKELEEVKAKLKEEEKSKEKANQIIEKMQQGIRDDVDKVQSIQFQNEKLNEKIAWLEKNMSKKEHVIQSLNKDLESEKETNFRLAIEIQQIPLYQAQIAELDKKVKEVDLINSQFTKLMLSNGIIPQYVPPPHFAEKLLACSEAINIQPSGNNDLHQNGSSAQPTRAVESKTKSSRFSDPVVENAIQLETRQTRKSLPGNSVSHLVHSPNSLQPEIRHMGLGVPGNCTNSPSQNFNAKSSTIIASDKNANHSNLEINSNVLSTEFKGLNVSKHSTARKQTKVKGSHIPVKS